MDYRILILRRFRLPRLIPLLIKRSFFLRRRRLVRRIRQSSRLLSLGMGVRLRSSPLVRICEDVCGSVPSSDRCGLTRRSDGVDPESTARSESLELKSIFAMVWMSFRHMEIGAPYLANFIPVGSGKRHATEAGDSTDNKLSHWHQTWQSVNDALCIRICTLVHFSRARYKWDERNRSKNSTHLPIALPKLQNLRQTSKKSSRLQTLTPTIKNASKTSLPILLLILLLLPHLLRTPGRSTRRTTDKIIARIAIGLGMQILRAARLRGFEMRCGRGFIGIDGRGGRSGCFGSGSSIHLNWMRGDLLRGGGLFVVVIVVGVVVPADGFFVGRLCCTFLGYGMS